MAARAHASQAAARTAAEVLGAGQRPGQGQGQGQGQQGGGGNGGVNGGGQVEEKAAPVERSSRLHPHGSRYQDGDISLMERDERELSLAQLRERARAQVMRGRGKSLVTSVPKRHVEGDTNGRAATSPSATSPSAGAGYSSSYQLPTVADVPLPSREAATVSPPSRPPPARSQQQPPRGGRLGGGRLGGRRTTGPLGDPNVPTDWRAGDTLDEDVTVTIRRGKAAVHAAEEAAVSGQPPTSGGLTAQEQWEQRHPNHRTVATVSARNNGYNRDPDGSGGGSGGGGGDGGSSPQGSPQGGAQGMPTMAELKKAAQAAPAGTFESGRRGGGRGGKGSQGSTKRDWDLERQDRHWRKGSIFAEEDEGGFMINTGINGGARGLN